VDLDSNKRRTRNYLKKGRKMELKRLVIHCTATCEGREVTSGEIRHWHCDPVSCGGRGWKQVGYSDMIHLDGSVENLVPYNEDDRVDNWEMTNGAAGFNGTSRHVVYVGGLDAKGRPKDTRTLQQKQALEEYVKKFRKAHPGAAVVGHHDLNPGKACPCFDVKELISN
jgi:N-acetylmuramoyl-L-alanine amidase